MSFPYEQAAIDALDALHRAEADLMHRFVTIGTIGRIIGRVVHVSLDDAHGVRVQIEGSDRWYPVSVLQA